MKKNKGKQTKQLISVLLACLVLMGIYFLEANGNLVLPEQETASKTVSEEEIQAQEIHLQDENLHVVYWDVGQADCILVQNKRKNNAD